MCDKEYVDASNAWFPPFRCLSAVAVSPFRSAVPQIPLPLRVRTEMLETPLRIHRDKVSRTLIGCPPTAERQNRIRSYCYGTAVTAQRQMETATAQRNFSRRQRNSYGIYVTGTAKRQQNGGNQASIPPGATGQSGGEGVY